MYEKQIETCSNYLLITSSLLLLVVITGAAGRLTETPKNKFVLNGTTVEFTCCSDIEEQFFWKVKYIGSHSTNDIYDTAGLVNGFRITGRFNVTVGDRSGCYSLIITDVRMQDVGTYFCIDREGLGQQIGWELVILESFNCQETYPKAEYMGENDFGLPQDVISASCISNYFGNVPPKPICEWFSGTQRLDNYYHATETNLTTTLNINIPARKEFNCDQLLCYVKIEEAPRANQRQTIWKSTKFNINYALYQQQCVSQCNGDKSSLGCDCQPPCSYKLGKFQNSSLYCEITYPVQPDGASNVLLIENTDSEAHQNSISETGWIVIAILAGIGGIVTGGLIIGLVVYFVIKRCPVKCVGKTETGRGINITCCAASPNQVVNDGSNVQCDAQETSCNFPSNVNRKSNNSDIKNNNKETKILLEEDLR